MAPLRPPGREAMPADAAAIVRALALPGGSPTVLARAAARHGSVVAGARAMLEKKAAALTGAERDRWEGWSRRVLEDLDDGIGMLVRGSPGYPEKQLAGLDPAPPVLFFRGNVALLEEPAVAIVGTRRCTRDGERTAERIAGGIAAAGCVVVSGLALGIDAAAHRGAGPRRTIAVLGCGVDVTYPPRHERLQEAIGAEGLLLSERLPGTPPYPFLFPERNRIIAGLGRAVVVVEAPEKSGALITADEARELGRPVLAVPGPLGQRQYEGSNARIRDQAARLVTGPEEVLRLIGMEVPEDLADRPPSELEGVGLALWRAVGTGTVHADELADAVGLDPAQGLASLLVLELQGHLRQLPGMRFVRTRTAVGAGG